ncbi:MAG: hypothetical protein ABLQ96_09825 [Candidatus Acidiferrum sp.]
MVHAGDGHRTTVFITTHDLHGQPGRQKFTSCKTGTQQSKVLERSSPGNLVIVHHLCHYRQYPAAKPQQAIEIIGPDWVEG